LPKAIEMMRKREEELLKAVEQLSKKTNVFTNPKLILIGGYGLRAYIPFSRYTRDCDFIVKKKNGWNLDHLKKIVPKDYSVEIEEKRESYGFMRLIKFIKYDKIKVKVSLDFMEGEIRGRKPEEVVLIDEKMVEKSVLKTIQIADKNIKVRVPSYLDYFIIKVVSSRPSDIRDIASLIHANGIPKGLKERVKQILPHPEIFKIKVERKIIPEISKNTFLDSWRGIFATTKYTEKDRKNVIQQLQKLKL